MKKYEVTLYLKGRTEIFSTHSIRKARKVFVQWMLTFKGVYNVLEICSGGDVLRKIIAE